MMYIRWKTVNFMVSQKRKGRNWITFLQPVHSSLGVIFEAEDEAEADDETETTCEQDGRDKMHARAEVLASMVRS